MVFQSAVDASGNHGRMGSFAEKVFGLSPAIAFKRFTQMSGSAKHRSQSQVKSVLSFQRECADVDVGFGCVEESGPPK